MTYAMNLLKGKSKSNGSGWMFLGLGLGALLGMAVGVLIAPKPGRETMQDIRASAANTVENIKTTVHRQAETIKNAAQHTMDTVKSAAQDTAKTVKNAAQDAADTMNQAAGQPATKGKTSKKRVIDLRNTAYEIGEEYGDSGNTSGGTGSSHTTTGGMQTGSKTCSGVSQSGGKSSPGSSTSGWSGRNQDAATSAGGATVNGMMQSGYKNSNVGGWSTGSQGATTSTAGATVGSLQQSAGGSGGSSVGSQTSGMGGSGEFKTNKTSGLNYGTSGYQGSGYKAGSTVNKSEGQASSAFASGLQSKTGSASGKPDLMAGGTSAKNKSKGSLRTSSTGYGYMYDSEDEKD